MKNLFRLPLFHPPETRLVHDAMLATDANVEEVAVVETRSSDSPVEVQAEVHTQPDRTTVAFQRILARLGQTDQGGIAQATAPPSWLTLASFPAKE